VLTILPEFDLGMSFGKGKSGIKYLKLRSKPVFIDTRPCRFCRCKFLFFNRRLWRRQMHADSTVIMKLCVFDRLLKLSVATETSQRAEALKQLPATQQRDQEDIVAYHRSTCGGAKQRRSFSALCGI